MWLLLISIVLNIILFIILFSVNRRGKIKRKKTLKIKIITERIINKQIKILLKGEYGTGSIELEIARYVKDVLLNCMVTGELNELDKKRINKVVLSEYPDICEEVNE